MKTTFLLIFFLSSLLFTKQNLLFTKPSPCDKDCKGQCYNSETQFCCFDDLVGVVCKLEERCVLRSEISIVPYCEKKDNKKSS